MKKIIFNYFIITSISLNLGAQPYIPANRPDSLRLQLLLAASDSAKLVNTLQLAGYYQFILPDSAIFYAKQGLELAREQASPIGESWAMRTMALAMRSYGNDPIALQLNLKSLKIAEKYDFTFDQALSLGQIGEIYLNAGDYDRALKFFYQSQKIMEGTGDIRPSFLLLAQIRILETFLSLSQLDSSEHHADLALQFAETLDGAERWPIPRLYNALGDFERLKGNLDRSRYYYIESIKTGSNVNSTSHYKLSRLYFEMGKHDSSIVHAKRVIELLSSRGLYEDIADTYKLLAQVFETIDPIKANSFNQLAIGYKDSLIDIGRMAALERFIDFDENERQQELNAAEAEFKNRLRMNALLGSSFTLLVLAVVLFRSRRQKQKSKEKIEKAYDQLKSTQSQLIYSEKMASLGELTAGIAHEIQNPLNFVNNFSDVNKELATEVLEELKKGNGQEAEAIIKDIIENEKKILHHGQRADAIVKGMLQHSRAGGGEKEPTDINALCDEYLRLAYHGLRAKDKNFNADFKTELDPNLPKVNIVPQDIGRVLLNLINNAFYAVSAEALAKAGGDYKPEVIVTTGRWASPLGDRGGAEGVQISIKDNGHGIPDDIKDKIFQPFFTTKSTGEGTGLGLSISYDIVTKGHGGTLEVSSEIEKGTEFIIRLPIN